MDQAPSPSKPCLEVIETRDTGLRGSVIAIPPEGISVGRRDGAELRILDRSVSRDHARFFFVGDQVAVADLGTTNGTYLNGARITRAVLRLGDVIRVGHHTVFRFARDSVRWSLRLTDALISARIALWEWHLDTGTIIGSRNFSQVTGSDPWSLPTHPVGLLELVHPEDADRVETAFRELVERDRPIETEIRIAARDGQNDMWLAVKGQAVRTREGRAITGSVANVTARKRCERELRRLTRVLENMYDAILVLDLEGRITDVSVRAESTFHLRRDQALGTAVADLVGEERFDELQREIGTRGHFSGELPVVVAPGSDPRVFEIAAAHLTDDDQWVAGYVVALRDITTKKQVEKQLVVADKLSALGTLAAGIAHEINNPLAFVQGGLDWLGERVDDVCTALPQDQSFSVRDVLREMRQGVARIAGIVRGMKTLSHNDDVPLGTVQLVRVIEMAERIVANELRQSARLTIDVPETVHVRANETGLMQVFINLLVNAVHAVQAVGDPSRTAIDVALEEVTADAVVLVVRDAGCGMDADTLQRVFTPFFTTKPIGKGTGLGLSVSRSIVEACSGSISIESRPDEGTTVRLRLPLAAAPAAQQPAAPAAEGRRSGRVLIVDDEPMVANSLARLLRSRGLDTEVATEGQVGLELALTGRFDVILCDLMMPGFGGVDLYDHLALAAPHLTERIVFVSGGAVSSRTQSFLDEVSCRLVAKPWTAEGLMAAVDAILSLRAGTSERAG